MRGLALVASVSAALVWVAPAGAAVTCRSGFSVHESEGIRLFVASRTRESDAALWGCTARLRRPAMLWESSPGVTLAGGAERRFGRRIGFEVEEYSDGGNGRWAGWFDLRSGRSAWLRLGGPRKRVDPEEDDSFKPATSALAVAPDGSIGFAYAAFGKTFELYASRYVNRRLRNEKAVVAVPEAEFDPFTLAMTTGELRWRTRGPAGEAALPRAPAVSKARRGRRPRGVGCQAGEGLYLGSTTRIFRTPRGLFACTDKESARPVALAGPRARLLHADTTGYSLAYAVREGRRETLGIYDTRNSFLRTRVRRTTDYGGRPEILGLATRSNGGIVYVAEVGVFHVPLAGRGLGAPVQLAAGRIAPHTVELLKDRVTWRAVGVPRSAPID